MSLRRAWRFTICSSPLSMFLLFSVPYQFLSSDCMVNSNNCRPSHPNPSPTFLSFLTLSPPLSKPKPPSSSLPKGATSLHCLRHHVKHVNLWAERLGSCPSLPLFFVMDDRCSVEWGGGGGVGSVGEILKMVRTVEST
jgi:hypothetical protein